MAEQREWFRFGLIGVAALLGAPTDVATAGFDRVFGHLDAAKKKQARALCTRVGGVLTQLARHADPGTIESARITTEGLLQVFGLTDERFAELGLDAEQAAAIVLRNGQFTSDEMIEVEPLCRQLLTCFYRTLPDDPNLLAELLPHTYREILRRLARLAADQQRNHRELVDYLRRFESKLDILDRLERQVQLLYAEPAHLNPVVDHSDTTQIIDSNILALIERNIRKAEDRIAKARERVRNSLFNVSITPAQCDQELAVARAEICGILQSVIDLNGGALPTHELRSLWASHRCDTVG